MNEDTKAASRARDLKRAAFLVATSPIISKHFKFLGDVILGPENDQADIKDEIELVPSIEG